MWEEKQFTQEELDTKTQEAINKYQSDSSAWIEKLQAETKLKDGIIAGVGKVAQNAESLVDIFEWDSAVGQAILDNYYDGKSIEEYKESIGYKETTEQLNDKLINQRASKIYDDNKYEEVVGEFVEKVGLEWDELEEFNAEMAERKAMKGYDPKKLKSYIKKSYKYVTGNSGDEIDKIKSAKIISKASNISAGNNKWAWEGKTPSQEVTSFLNSHLD